MGRPLHFGTRADFLPWLRVTVAAARKHTEGLPAIRGGPPSRLSARYRSK